MTDKTVTYGDLSVLRVARDETGDGAVVALLDRLIAAAEADRPPLPEGWYLVSVTNQEGEHVGNRMVFHADGSLYERDDRNWYYGALDTMRDRLTPLRPAVTEADVEKATQVLYGVGDLDDGWPEWASEDVRSAYRNKVRAAFEAAGIEVRDA